MIVDRGRPSRTRTFKVQPHCGGYRRRSQASEAQPQTTEAWGYATMTSLMRRHAAYTHTLLLDTLC